MCSAIEDIFVLSTKVVESRCDKPFFHPATSECPKCHCRYDLARGGCLHFKCGQCPTDFCGGCGEVYDKARYVVGDRYGTIIHPTLV